MGSETTWNGPRKSENETFNRDKKDLMIAAEEEKKEMLEQGSILTYNKQG
jgi:hypothetical protein